MSYCYVEYAILQYSAIRNSELKNSFIGSSNYNSSALSIGLVNNSTFSNPRLATQSLEIHMEMLLTKTFSTLQNFQFLKHLMTRNWLTTL